jgi:sugar lactone lactonase YvrE
MVDEASYDRGSVVSAGSHRRRENKESVVRTSEVLSEGYAFLDGPRWHQGQLWMSDISAGTVFRVSMDGQRQAVADVPGSPSGLGFLPDGTPIVASMLERRLYRIADGALSLYADLTALSHGMLNDMAIDGLGRAYVGNVGYNAWAEEPKKPGSLVLVDTDGAARTVAEGLESPNGITISSSGRLAVAESSANRLTSFRIQPDGSLSDRRVEISLDGEPDGCCTDEHDGYWVAVFFREKFVRVRDGLVVETVAVPGRLAVGCELGGPEGRELFCLTFQGTLSDIGKVRTARVEVVRTNSPLTP